MSVLYDDVQIWQINSQELFFFEIYAVSIKIPMIEYHHLINGLVDHYFILTQQSMGRNEYGISGHLHIFASIFFKALNGAFGGAIFSGLHFTPDQRH